MGAAPVGSAGRDVVPAVSVEGRAAAAGCAVSALAIVSGRGTGAGAVGFGRAGLGDGGLAATFGVVLRRVTVDSGLVVEVVSRADGTPVSVAAVGEVSAAEAWVVSVGAAPDRCSPPQASKAKQRTLVVEVSRPRRVI